MVMCRLRAEMSLCCLSGGQALTGRNGKQTFSTGNLLKGQRRSQPLEVRPFLAIAPAYCDKLQSFLEGFGCAVKVSMSWGYKTANLAVF